MFTAAITRLSFSPQRIYADELFAIEDEGERFKRLVELNTVEQALNLYKTAIIQRKQKDGSCPTITPTVFDPTTGELKRLDVDYKTALKSLGKIYDLM